MSVTGQPLELALDTGFRGKQTLIRSELLNNVVGQCLPRESYEKLNQLGEGSKSTVKSFLDVRLKEIAYGVVFRARDVATSRVVALKQVRISAEERQNGVPITALREISILRSLKHNNIINVIDVAVGEHAMGQVYMVMEYAEQVGIPMPEAQT